MATVRRLTSVPGLLSGPYFFPIVAVPLAVVAVLAVKAVDAQIGFEGTRLHFPVANVRAVFGGVAGGVITATAVVFWVRSALVQLAASRLSPRVLGLYMHDRFQQASIGFLIGAFTYLVLVLLTLPRSPDVDAPLVTTLLGVALAVSALLVIVLAIIKAIYATRVSAVLASIGADTQAQVERAFPRHGVTPTPRDVSVPEAPEAECVSVTSTAHGWVQDVDTDGLLELLPPGCRFWLDVRVGMYVTADAHLASLLLPSTVSDADRSTLVSAAAGYIHIRPTRSLDQDPSFGIRELVDVGLSAVAPGTHDTTAGFEVILQLGNVLREILLRDLPPTVVQDDAGRTLFRTAELTHDDYVDLCFQQLRLFGSRYPSIAIGLLSTLGMLKGQLHRADLPDRAGSLQRQGELVVLEMEKSDLLPADRERVYRTARWYGFVATLPRGAGTEAPAPAEQLLGHEPA